LLAARVLRHLDPQDRAATLLRDRFVAWAPEGSSVVAATTIGTEACRDLVVRQWVLDRGQEEEILRSEICGDVTALGQSFGTSYVTLSDGERCATYGLTASSRFVSSIDGWGLVGVSRRGTQLVVPTAELPVTSPQPLGRFAGSQGLIDEPTMYGLDGEELRFEALLGWAGGDAGAYVLGTYGGERGVYLVAVDEGGGGKFPPFLAAPLEAGVPSLTETGDGVAVLALDGRWYRVRDGSLQGLEPPDGAPAPEGPIVWIPSVPDSAGEVA
jgi:hypothetical protein